MAELYRISPESDAEPRLDLVFVHGLNGHWHSTWRRRIRWSIRWRADRCFEFWPGWLDEELGGGVCVHSLSYAAKVSAWRGWAMPLYDRATNCAELLVSHGLGARPLAFVCHSLGGLVVKQILRNCLAVARRGHLWETLLNQTRGVVFFATPHGGSPLADIAGALDPFLRTTAAVETLRYADAPLRDLNFWYKSNVESLEIENHVFRETRPTRGMLVVDELSSDLGLPGVPAIPLDADHLSICKPARDGEGFLSTVRFLRGLLAALPTTGISGRAGPALSQAARRGNLPYPDDLLLGREDEIERLAALLTDSEERLVTIVGRAGVGKSRLAVEAARRVAEGFPGGVWRIDLTEARSAEGVALGVARALQASAGAIARPRSSVTHLLREQPPLLLVFDNIEGLPSEASAFLGELVRDVETLRILATGRERLRLRGETVLALGSLEVPGKAPAVPLASEAERLFLDRATRAQPGFELRPGEEEAVAAICRLLQGLPLGIELAAAQAKFLRPLEILEQLQATGGPSGGEERDLALQHRGLFPIESASYGRLPEADQRALQQLSLFRGGFSRDAARAVVDRPFFGSADATLLRLLQGQWLASEPTRFGTRYRLPAPIREFAAEKLAREVSAEALARLERRFADYYLSEAEIWLGQIDGSGAAEALDRIELESENLLVVYDRALRKEDGAAPPADPETAARAVLGLGPLFELRRPSVPAVGLIERARAALGYQAPELAVRLMLSACRVHGELGAFRRAAELVAEARALAHQEALAQAEREALRWEAEISLVLSEYEDARRAIAEALQLCPEDDLAQRSALLRLEGRLHRFLTNPRAAISSLEKAAQLARETGRLRLLGQILLDLVGARSDADDNGSALTLLDEVEMISARLADPGLRMDAILWRGVVHDRLDEPADALLFYRQLRETAAQYGDRHRQALALANEANVDLKQGRYDDAARGSDEAAAIFSELGRKSAAASATANAAEACFRKGDLPMARSRARDAWNLFVRLGETSLNRFLTGALLARIELEAGDLQSASRLARDAHRLATAIDVGPASANPSVRDAFGHLGKVLGEGGGEGRAEGAL